MEQSAIRRPDLAIFDLKMPGMDGVDLCRQFREVPELAAVPVVFVTGTADEEDLVRCFEAGAVDFLSKPIVAAELLQRVRTHLELKHARERLREMNDEKNEFLGIAAHDLRSPLNAVQGYTEMLLE